MLNDRIVLITGASRGIGAATAQVLARHGAAVAVNYATNGAAARHVVDGITANGGRALAVQADVRVAAEVGAMAETVRERLGPVDSLVLNAHISAPVGAFAQQSWEDFEAKVTGEMRAAYHCVKAVLPRMLDRRDGRIVAISSGVSQYPPPGASAHSVAKAALNAFMRSLALELGPDGIRVNTIAPGLIMTDNTAPLPEHFKQAMAASTPLRRNGHPADVAGAILMFLQDEARFITGAYVDVDGGARIGQSGADISAVNRSQVPAAAQRAGA
jgi:3-oxoacyl-[acyl-carrier protein] reductase